MAVFKNTLMNIPKVADFDQELHLVRQITSFVVVVAIDSSTILLVEWFCFITVRSLQ